MGSEMCIRDRGDIVDLFMSDLDSVTVVDTAGKAVGMITVTEALGALRG